MSDRLYHDGHILASVCGRGEPESGQNPRVRPLVGQFPDNRSLKSALSGVPGISALGTASDSLKGSCRFLTGRQP